MKKVFTITIFLAVLSAVYSSCASSVPEVFEGIYNPALGIGYSIELYRNDSVYMPYAVAAGRLLADGSKTTLDVPYGRQIGFFQGDKEFDNERFRLYEVAGYNPDEWLYMLLGNKGSRGIVLYKADGVTDVPTQFERLKVPLEGT